MQPGGDEPPRLTPTEARLLALLSDGLPHGAAELRSCLRSDDAERGTLHWHVWSLRRKLPEGHGIVYYWDGRAHAYRRVRFYEGGP
jgi:hypothetical protein